MTLTQIDKAGTVVGGPLVYDCMPAGCERLAEFEVEGKSYGFMVAFTFIPRGAYIAVQPLAPAIRKVIEFEKGFEAPMFVQTGTDQHYSGMLRFTLVGPAVAESEAETPQIMSNSTNLVFHRKLVPDLTLKLELSAKPPTP